MLHQLEHSVKSKSNRPNKKSKEKVDEESKQVTLDTVSFVLDHVLNHDEPPTLLGVRVDPTLITLLNKSVAGTIAASSVSAISKKFF